MRRSAAQSLPELLRCVVLAQESGSAMSPTFCAELLAFMWEPLMNALRSEPEPDVLCAMVEAVAEVIELLDVALINPAMVQTAHERLKVRCGALQCNAP